MDNKIFEAIIDGRITLGNGQRATMATSSIIKHGFSDAGISTRTAPVKIDANSFPPSIKLSAVLGPPPGYRP